MTPIRKVLIGGFVCAGIASAGKGQTLSVQGGAVSQQLQDRHSAYQVEYLEELPADFSVSIGYINEGHFSDSFGANHRDGYPLEFWYEIPLTRSDGLKLMVGAGPYLWFDTQTPNGLPSKDVHNVAPIGSLSISQKLGNRWYVFATAERIQAIGDFKDNLVLVGAGVSLGGTGQRGAGEASLPGVKPIKDALRDEVTFSPVLSVINISGNPRSIGGAVEYRHRWERHLESTVTYIYEGDPRVVRRSGVAVQVWPERSTLGGRVEVGFGAGAYAFIDERRVQDRAHDPAALAPMISAMLTVRMSERWFIRGVWDRVLTADSHDADITRIGVGYRF